MRREWIHICVCFLITIFHSSYGKATQDSTTYKAAVMEYSPIYVKDDGKQTIERNAAKYVEYIKKAGEQDADIIVFPEDGLTTTFLPPREEMDSWTTIIPSASDNCNPCTDDNASIAEVLKNISCAAKNNGIYVVINIAEKLPCTGDTCPTDNVYYYNSNVVFDRLGKIIARYRKTNLFLEHQFNVTASPEIVTFDTDFGVKFGTFICFDILFPQPSLNLTRDLKVTDIVYPTAWFSELPFLTAVQTQVGWSYAEDVNFLASGYDNPKRGNSGSGIYLGRDGIGKAILPLSDHEEMLVFDVPKKNRASPAENVGSGHTHSHEHTEHSHTEHSHTGHSHRHDELRRKREATNEHSYRHDELRRKRETTNELVLLHEELDSYETVLLNDNVTRTVCHNELCCEFNIVLKSVDPATFYRIVVFNGRRMFVNIYPAGIRSCAIVQCSDETLRSCGSGNPSNTIFESINITGKFDDYKESVIMPSTLGPNFVPLKNWNYGEHKHDDHVHTAMRLTAPQDNIVTFGIYARVYNADN